MIRELQRSNSERLDEKPRTHFTYWNAAYEYHDPGRSISLGVRAGF